MHGRYLKWREYQTENSHPHSHSALVTRFATLSAVVNATKSMSVRAESVVAARAGSCGE
jgi:hypothetical protein